MKREKNLPLILCTVLFLMTAGTGAHPFEAASPEWGYALDLPELWILQEKSGNDRYRFSHEILGADLLIALYPHSGFPDAGKALSYVNLQLAPQADEVSFVWRHRGAAIGRVETDTVAGWTLAVELAEQKGWLVLAGISAPERAVECEDLIISTLDAVFTDHGSRFEAGPMTTFAWPENGDISGTFAAGRRVTNVSMMKDDAEANQSVVDREFRLLSRYLDRPEVFDAWKRYYRMIWRDAWKRLEQAVFDTAAQLEEDPYKRLEQLLAWTQGFSYERDPGGSDFLNLPQAFLEQRGDCDSRALLLVLLMNMTGTDAVLLISPEYSHSVAGIDCPGTGARFESGGIKYLLADTTARVKPGLIAADMADPSKWFAVHFAAVPGVGIREAGVS